MVSDLSLSTAQEVQALPREQFWKLWKPFQETKAGQELIKARCDTDRVLFAKIFFAEKLDRPFSRFHLAALRAPKTRFRLRGPMSGTRRARMGPRGNGKTTCYVRIEVVHDILYLYEEYIAVLAGSSSLARSRVRELSIELERNKKIVEYFGDLKGEVWRVGQGEFETSTGVAVLAKSRKSQVRGLLHPVTNARPTKILADDFENSEEVINPEIREKDLKFWKEDVEGAGTTDGRTNFQITGTPLHREALIMSQRNNPGWDFQAFPAVEQWPKRMDLWEKCRAIFTAAGSMDDETDGEKVGVADNNAIELAQRYYKAHKKKMDEGARVLWSEGEPLFALFVYLWTNGEAAFSKEKQLVPRDPSLATFEMTSEDYPKRGALRHRIQGNHLVIDQRDGTTRKVPLVNLRPIGFLDPAKADASTGRSRKRSKLGDYACIPTMLVETALNGGRFGHVVDVWLERKPPSVQISTAFDLCEKWRYDLFVLEEDTYGLLKGDFKEEAARRKALRLFHDLPLAALAQQVKNKEVRISTMEPAIVNGWLTFNVDLPRRYWDQMIDHPTGDYDDGPDGTENCWRRRGFKRTGLTSVSMT